MPRAAALFLLLSALCAPSLALTFVGAAAAIPSAAQLRWMAFEVGSMITFNLQTACVPCGGAGAAAQRCQRPPGCLPAWPGVRAWALPDLNVSAWLAASAAFGARYSVLVADHMAGFTLWPTAVHNVSIAATAYARGRGDVVADFRAAAAAANIAPGFFYSTHYNYALGVDDYRAGAVPRAYGGPPLDAAAYEAAAIAQLRELAAYEADGHGPWAEAWFDGGVNLTATPRVGGVVRELFPGAICHSCAGFTEASPGGADGRGVRWMGNEDGAMPLPSWAAVGAAAGVTGDPEAPLFIPPSCDTVLDEHFWFWVAGDDAHLRSACALINVYLTSVGRASNLILNLAPDARGGIAAAEVDAYARLGADIACLWRAPVASWAAAAVDLATGVALLPLGAPRACAARAGCVLTLVLQEDLSRGQRVGAWAVDARVDGAWVRAVDAPANATTGVGHKRIVAARVGVGAAAATSFDALRVVVGTAYSARGNEAAPLVFAAAALFDRAAAGACLPAGCALVDY